MALNRNSGRLALAAAMAIGFRAHGQCEVVAPDLQPRDGLDFGRAVALSEDTAAVADVIAGRAGAVFVFGRVDGRWSLDAQLEPDDSFVVGQYFGTSLHVDGDVLVVGDHLAFPPNDAPSGVAYVYRKSLLGWTLEQRLLGSTATGNFAQAVACDGDLIAVGSPGAGAKPGHVVIFRHDGESWQEEAALVNPSGGSSSNQFGRSVALCGSTLFVGEPLHPPGATGAAHVFRNAHGLWSLTQTFPNASPNRASFGRAVAVQGEVAVIGAPNDISTGSSYGAAFVYRFGGSQWSLEQQLVPTSPSGPDGQFGQTVGITPDEQTIVVGAQGDWEAGHGSGATYIFRNLNGTWTQVSKFSAAEGALNLFGASVAVTDDLALIGSPGNNIPGLAHLFAGINGADCNGNGQADTCEILEGLALDQDNDGTPDACELPGDTNLDGAVDVDDLVNVITEWGPCTAPCNTCLGDTDGDCDVDVDDLVLVVLNWT